MGGKLTYPRQEITEDRVFLITGGNTGIGYQTAKCIAQLGGKVVIACRSEEKAKQAIEKMQKENQEEVRKKRADQKAAAAKEKAAADKAAAAKAKAEADKAKKSEEAKKEAAKEDAAKEDAPKEDAPKEDAAKEDGAKEDAPKEDAPKEDAPKEDAANEKGAKEDAAKDETSKAEDTPKEAEGASADAAAADTKASSEGEATEAKKEEEEEVEEPIEPLKVEFMELDLATFASTMKFVEAYKAKGYPLHVLICNAGFGAGPLKKSEDDYELHFQVNYLSHFLMTLHLLPLLRESAPNSRIINVSSVLHSSGVFNLENMNGEQSYDRVKFYGNSKLYQIMNMYSFERRLKESNISVFSVHPGYVDSEFNRGTADSKFYSFMDSLAGTFRMKRSVEDGAMTSLLAALDKSLDGKTGLYFKNCKAANPSALSRKSENQEALWKYSLECLKDYVTEELLKDLQLPEPEPAGESKPEGEAAEKAEGDAAVGAGGDASAAEGEKKSEEAKPEKGEGAGEKKEEKKEEETKEETKEEGAKEGGD